MTSLFSRTAEFLRKVRSLALPYGKGKLIFVLASMILVGVLQLGGVASIVPFLSVAAEPDEFSRSQLGGALMTVFHIENPSNLVYVTGILSIVSLAVASVAIIVNQLLVSKYVGGVGHALRMRLLNKYYSQPYAYFVSRNSAVLTKKANADVFMFTTFLLSPLCDFLARLCTTIIVLGGLLVLEPGATLGCAVLFGAFYLLFMRFTRSRVRAINDINKNTSQALSRLVQQFIVGMRDIKLRDAGQHFIQRVEVSSYQQVGATVSSAWIGTLPRNLIEPVAFTATVIWAMLALRSGRLNEVLPTLGVMAMAGYRLLPNVQMLYNNLHLVAANSYSLDELREELEVETPGRLADARRPALPSPAGRALFSNAIELRDIVFQYAGAERPTLRGVNLRIGRGESVGFVGQTGSGKSTLINLLLGLYDPTGGQILADGVALSHPVEAGWYTRIGYVPQEIFMMDDSLLRNIALGVSDAQIDRDRINRAVDSAQLREVVDKLPKGLETQVGERGLMLSGGQRQRVGLARALYFDPEMLILDEGTSALDNETEAKFMRAVESLQGQITILLIAHRLSTVRNCNAIHVLVGGQVAESGTYDELMSSESEFYKLAMASN